MTREHAKYLRSIIESQSVNLTDDVAIDAVELFPVWKANGEYSDGERVRYNGVLYRCLQSHAAQETWTPTDAPSLWAKLLIPDADAIPEWEQPNSTNLYRKGDKVMYGGETWESIVDNNAWAPSVYGWKRV